VVNDIEFWIDFLTEDFEFRIWKDQLETGLFISKLIGFPETRVRTVKLRDKNDSVIELLRFESPKSNNLQMSSLEPNSMGITHIAFQVESMEIAIQKLSNRKCYPISTPLISPDKQAIVAYVRGPENVLLEIVEVSAQV
jgi:hypothetical protein